MVLHVLGFHTADTLLLCCTAFFSGYLRRVLQYRVARPWLLGVCALKAHLGRKRKSREKHCGRRETGAEGC